MYPHRWTAKVPGMLSIRRASLLTALALAAVPAAAHADVTVGSDLTDAPDQTLTCAGGSPCTFAWDADGWFDGRLREGQTLTRWSANLAPGAKARLRLLRREVDGTFTGAGASAVVTAAGGPQTFTTDLDVPFGDYTIGVDLLSGGLRAATDDQEAFGVERIAPALGDAETRGGQHLPVQALLSAVTEEPVAAGPGDDGGGTPPPRGEVLPPREVLPPAEAPAAPVLPGGDAAAGASVAKELSKPDFAFDARAMVDQGVKGDQGSFRVYYESNARGTLDADVTVRSGRRVVGTKKLTEVDSGDHEDFQMKLSAKDARKLRRAGRLKLAVSARVAFAHGGTSTVAQTVTLVTGTTTKYDGEYRGPGPFTITVDHGAIRSISASVNAFCPGSNRFELLSIFRLDGFPVLVGRDGSFKAEGNVISQLVRYEGTLRLKGESRGYASAFKTTMRLDSSNRFQLDGCQGATNWTVRKVR